MGRVLRPRIDDEAAFRAGYPRIGPFQREGAGIGGQNSEHPKARRGFHAYHDASVAAGGELSGGGPGGNLPVVMSARPSPHPGRTPSLSDRLRARIEAGGLLTFDDFMEAALYDPDDGFYARRVVGEAGDFVTSPHVSPVFGILLATQIEEFWNLLGRPDPFSVVEVGAGDGTLARQVLGALPNPLRGVTRYSAVDRSATARATLADLDVSVAADLSDVSGPLVGCVVANELLDNLPFHRLRWTAGGVVELYVGLEGERFVLHEGRLSRSELADHLPDLTEGSEWLTRPSAVHFIEQARRVLSRGYVWISDYELSDPGPTSVHGYRHHRLEGDVLADPGSRDITAGVDFAAIARDAMQRGLSVWGPVTQREALLALGFRDLDHRAQARQIEAIERGRGIDAMRIYSNRTRANLLLARGGLGDFSWLCLGVGIDEAPRSVSNG